MSDSLCDMHGLYCLFKFLKLYQYNFIGFCEQSINSIDYIVTYDVTPSYTQSTATLRCIKGYVTIEPGSAVCGDDGEWIIQYPKCEGIHAYLKPILLFECPSSVLFNYVAAYLHFYCLWLGYVVLSSLV